MGSCFAKERNHLFSLTEVVGAGSPLSIGGELKTPSTFSCKCNEHVDTSRLRTSTGNQRTKQSIAIHRYDIDRSANSAKRSARRKVGPPTPGVRLGRSPDMTTASPNSRVFAIESERQGKASDGREEPSGGEIARASH